MERIPQRSLEGGCARTWSRLADGLRCLQADPESFGRIAEKTLDDTRKFVLDGDYAGGRACAAEICLVIVAMRDLGADGYDLADVDGTLSPEERERLMRALQID